MTAEVIAFKVGEVGAGVKLDADTLLENNKGAFNELVLLGWDADGDMVLASTEGPADTLWLIEAAKKFLLNGCSAD